MQNIGTLLNKDKFKKPIEHKRDINLSYEEAQEFGKYVGLNTIFVLRLFKTYGKQKVLNLRSWLKDMPNKETKKLPGLIIWKLKRN